MTHKLFLAGFGGQGILLIGQMLAYAGMLEGKEVTFLPSYGPEMRGGTANCTVIVSDTPINCPILDRATCLVAMNFPSLIRFEDIVAPEGKIFINSSLVHTESSRNDVGTYYIDAVKIAKELGNEKTANIVMLGAVVKATEVVKPESLDKVMEKLFTGKKSKLIAPNRKALFAWNNN